MLVSDFMVNSKLAKVFYMESTECLSGDAKKEKNTDPVHRGRADQITTSVKLLDTAHESYGFSADLIEKTN